MQWIKYSESKPLKDMFYIVLSLTFCEECEKNEQQTFIMPHAHRLNFKRCKYDIALWHDNKFCESFLMDREIDYWMEFPNWFKE